MNTYIYFTWIKGSSFTGKEIIFKCDATDIETADKQFSEATGKDATKNAIQCQITPNLS